MSKEFKNIDELFKSTIGQGSAVAPESVKAKVMANTGGNNWWIVGAALLLMTAVGGIIMTLNMPKEAALAMYQPREKANFQKFEKNTPVDIEKHNTFINSTSENITITEYDDIEKQTTAVKNSTVKAENRKSEKQIRNSENKATSTNKNTLSKSAPSYIVAKNNSSIKQDNLMPKNNSGVANNITPNHQTPINEVLEEKKSKGIIEKSTNTVPSLNNKHNDTVLFKDANASTLEMAQVNSILLPTLANDTLLHVATPIISDAADSVETEVKLEKQPENNKGYWMAGLVLGPNINKVNYSGTELSESLNKFHSERLGFHAQLYGQYVTPSKLLLATGIGFENQSYNTTFLTTITSLEIESNSIFSHYVYDDSSNVIIDSVYTIQYDTTEITSLKNHYGLARNQYIQSPFRIGYQVEKNKWIFGADVSVQLNYLLNTKGDYFTDNTVLNLNEANIVKRTTFNYSVGANIQYNVFNNIFLKSEIQYSPGIQNYYESAYAKRAVNSLQLGFGIGLKL